MKTGISAIQEKLQQNVCSVSKLVDGSGVILDVSGHQVLTLNEAGMVLVESLQHGVDDQQQLVDKLSEVFEVEPEQANRDVAAFLALLAGSLGVNE